MQGDTSGAVKIYGTALTSDQKYNALQVQLAQQLGGGTKPAASGLLKNLEFMEWWKQP